MTEITDETIMLHPPINTNFYSHLHILISVIHEFTFEFRDSKDKNDVEFFKTFDQSGFIEIVSLQADGLTSSDPTYSVCFSWKHTKILLSSSSWVMTNLFGFKANASASILMRVLKRSSNIAIYSDEKFISETQRLFDLCRKWFHNIPEVISYMDSLKGQ